MRTMIKIRGDLSMRKKEKMVFAYLVGVVFILSFHYFMDIREYPCDAGSYWSECSAYYGLEKFNLLNYKSALRGYLFPLLMYAIQKLDFVGIGSNIAIFRLAASLLYSFLFILLIPKLIELMFKIVVPVRSRLIYLIICMIMLRGLILYPLTDLPGILLVCFSIYLFVTLMQDKIKEKRAQIFCTVCMGICLGGAYYIRPIYLIVWIVLGGIILISAVKKGRRILLLSIVGMLIIMMPQICINQKNFGTYSPMIQTQFESGGTSLYLAQLKAGIRVQKYETSMDDSAEDIPMAMVFEDSTGASLLQGAGKIYSYPRYVIFCISHFADMACIYLKHIFNGMDIVYPNAYIQKVYCNRFIVQFFNYTMIFVGVNGLLFFIKKKCWDGLTIGMTVTYCFPTLLVIPTAVEPRFFVGVHLVLYLFAALALAEKEWWHRIWQCKWKQAGAYLLFLGICFVLNSQTFNCYGIPLW